MNKFHVILTDRTERDITADEVEFHQNGSISFINEKGWRIITYAPGEWVMVEKEARDDRG